MSHDEGPGRYGQRRHPERREGPRDQTQPIPRVADNRETRVFQRPGDTHMMPLELSNSDGTPEWYDLRKGRSQAEKANPKPYRPGIVMRWFGHALATLLAVLCLGVISITIAFILVKYYSHLFQ